VSGASTARRLAGLLALAQGLSGCAAGYVARAAYEEARILWRRQPIERVLARPDLPDADREKLRLVLAVRKFAEERIGLRVRGSYGSISQVDGRAVVQLLIAAPRDSLEPYTWWFPVVGRVPYKGFFSKAAAKATAAALERDGYDTYVRPAIAFSTLGWFDDPLPSPLLKRDAVTLAEVIFHELFHNTVYLAGETVFDESSATFAGNRAAIEFFCEGDGADSAHCREATEDWQDTLTISAFLEASINRLEKFYSTKPTKERLDEGRAEAFEEIRTRFKALKLHPGRYADFAVGPINNASLLEQRVYLRDLDVFDELYHAQGSLAATVRVLKVATEQGGDPFDRVREAVAGKRPQVASVDAGGEGS
jgi:predicted aminopeptidase